MKNCTACKKPIKMIVRQGSDFCSENCEDAFAKRRPARDTSKSPRSQRGVQRF